MDEEPPEPTVNEELSKPAVNEQPSGPAVDEELPGLTVDGELTGPAVDEGLIARYLARRDPVGRPVDRIVLLGSAVVESVAVAAAAHRTYSALILVSGGIGHSTQYLDEAIRRRGLSLATGRPESHVFRDLLIRDGVAPTEIVVEDESANCGENAEFTRRLITAAETLLLIQDPTMQRRTHACFERSFTDLPGTRLFSYAPLIPWISTDQVSAGPGTPPIWSRARFRSLLLGEIHRLSPDGYGPRGRDLIDHVDIPAEVQAAYNRLAASHPEDVRHPTK
ncbi:YdcF family protein [Kribbella hippodromi]|uniref:YdcF family protein n=1 Tax=Kribbella hippodromi TaxID=434347 RepID=A0ABP4NDX5_9ACTN